VTAESWELFQHRRASRKCRWAAGIQWAVSQFAKPADADGSRASGPPERGLFEYDYKVERGKLLIRPGEMPTPGAPSARLIDISARKPSCA
jgi:hypothetical protein